MTLHVETLGTGPDLVMLHGWGMHSGVWHDTAQRLSTNFRVTLIDLPGHGYSRTLPERYTITQLAQSVAGHSPPRAHWLGWSLGGLVAQHLALNHPQHVNRLVLVASSPQFVRDKNWPHAMAESVLDQFATNLARDFRQTLQRFLALELQGSANAREHLRLLRERLYARGEPVPEALAGGLDILKGISTRAQLSQLRAPSLWLLGANDALVPKALSSAIAALAPTSRTHIIEHAGHAPFISHPVEFEHHVREFLHE